jgi:hypothetical protein
MRGENIAAKSAAWPPRALTNSANSAGKHSESPIKQSPQDLANSAQEDAAMRRTERLPLVYAAEKQSSSRSAVPNSIVPENANPSTLSRGIRISQDTYCTQDETKRSAKAEPKCANASGAARSFIIPPGGSKQICTAAA